MSSVIRLIVPASAAWVVLVRTAASACCARLDFDVDRLEDVRLAVDEAVSQVILDAPAGSDVTCGFRVSGADLDITITAASLSGQVPAHDTFSWIVLRALVDTVTAEVDEGLVRLHLHIHRHVPVDA